MLIIDSDEGLDASLTQELVEIANLNGLSNAETISNLLGENSLSRTDTANAERPLGGREHLFWLLDQNRSFHFAMVAQIAGSAAPDEWRRALDRVQWRHPLFRVASRGALAPFPGSASVPARRFRSGSWRGIRRETGSASWARSS